jgi:hypothetical protein
MSPAFAPARARPEGSWQACPRCGMSGTLDRIRYWQGVQAFTETVPCARCNGGGWLPAPWYYALPRAQWPEGAT